MESCWDSGEVALARGSGRDTDFDLLDRWAAGDTRAAAELVDRHLGALHRFVRSRAFRDVDDIVQDTLLACIESRNSFRRTSSFRTYLLAIARHVVLGHGKRQRRLGDPTGGEAEELPDRSPIPSSIVERQAEQRSLCDAMRRLPTDRRTILELRYFEGLTGPRLALRLGISEGAVRMRLHRAKRELRDQVASPVHSASSNCQRPRRVGCSIA